MRNRTFIYFLIGLFLAIVLVGAATNVAVGTSRSPQTWLRVQQHNPLLWMVDGCAAIILLGSCLFGAAGGQSLSGDDASRKLTSLTDTVEELLVQNSRYRARLEDLEEAGDAWHEGFENEARRLTEQAFLALSDNIEANAEQLEAVIMALRYQRAETRAVRTALKTRELAPEGDSPPPLDSVARPARAIVQGFDKSTPAIEPELELEAEAEPETAQDADREQEKETVGEPASESTVSVPASVLDTDTDNAPVSPTDTETTGSAGDKPPPYADADTDNAPVSPTDTETTRSAGDKPPPYTDTDTESMNAGTTLVEMLDFDASAGANKAIVSDAAPTDSGSKSSMAADEFRRSKQGKRSIFGLKRP